jgi:hypothetical protein
MVMKGGLGNTAYGVKSIMPATKMCEKIQKMTFVCKNDLT